MQKAAHMRLLTLCAIFITASFCVVAADPISESLSTLLPKAFLVSSAGTFVHSFTHPLGFSRQIFFTGLLLVGLLFLWPLLPGLIAFGTRLLNISSKRMYIYGRVLILITFLGVSFIYSYLAEPPNFWPSNAKYLWVDPIYPDAPYWQTYPLLCAIHQIFYERPVLLVAIFSAFNAFLFYLILRAIGLRGLVSYVSSVSFALSSNMLHFANISEGVLVNISALLVVLLCYLRHWSFGLGASLFLAYLGRPQFLSLLLAICATEFAFGSHPAGTGFSSWLKSKRWLLPSAGIFLFMFGTWQILTVLRRRNLFAQSGGGIDFLNSLQAKAIDEFTIYPWSGAYLGHYFWHFPFLLSVLSIASLFVFTRLTPLMKKSFVFSWAMILVNFTFHEMYPGFYYNIRYMSYYFPFVLILAIISVYGISLRVKIVSEASRLRAALFILFAGSLFTTYPMGVEVKQAAQKFPLTALYPYRAILSSWAEKGPVFSEFESRGMQNYQSYLFRKPTGITYHENVSEMLKKTYQGTFVLRQKEAVTFCSEILLFPSGQVCYIESPKSHGNA